MSGGVLNRVLAALFLAGFWIQSHGFPPGEAVRRMSVLEGFEVSLVAAEPLVRQPVAIEFDDRGRLWVVQYLQYPNPAGLKRVKVDRYSRTVYDRIPEPPPAGPKGADRITILEDTDGDGLADTARDFVSGLNLATGLAFGHGGVYVLQTPYLLFYPDRDRDDIPDGDPEVLLSGFGMEDAHSVANSLTWGPDGWLYGCQGSTVTARVRDIEFQQGVWRYHPISRRFELFCEGGGNSWGLDFDGNGDLIYSTNVGGFRMLHGVQGGYYWKSFGKHGALHNPYTFGYFDHVPHRNFQGGHVTVGGIVYQGDSFPERFRGKYICGDLLGHGVQWHELQPMGSTFSSAHGGILLDPKDTWFAPSDLTLGPDGAIYVADWQDQRTAHPDPDAEWDRSNGRVYRLQARGAMPAAAPRFLELPSVQLAGLLSSGNNWVVRQARRTLAERRDPLLNPELRRLIFEHPGSNKALEALWALHVNGGFGERIAEQLLDHENPRVRRWTVRLLGDEDRVSPRIARKLLALAETEPDVRVRSQIASTAQRLPVGLFLAHRLLKRNLDAADTHLPLLLWWAVERHAISGMDSALELFSSPSAWEAPMIRNVIQERLMRRYAGEGTSAALSACARLLASAPNTHYQDRLMAALDQGLQRRFGPPGSGSGDLYAGYAAVERNPPPAPPTAGRIPEDLETQIAARWSSETTDTNLVRVAARLGRPSAHERALELVMDAKAPLEVRVSMLQLLAQIGQPTCLEPVLTLVGSAGPEEVRLIGLDVLQRFDSERVGEALTTLYPTFKGRARVRAREVLMSRKAWALAFLSRIERDVLLEIPVDQVRSVALFRDKTLDDQVRKIWGTISPGTPEEKLAEMRRLNNDLRAPGGEAGPGRELFQRLCAGCHRLFGEGGQTGPDLTHANRKDRDHLLASLVDPSAVIRKEFSAYTAETKDGRVLSGLIVEETPAAITFVAATGERTTIGRGEIERMDESGVSLMPEGLLQALKPGDLRDLFAYLQSDGGGSAPPTR